ncbi:hypothetical protein Q31b_55780 [Novipirellula aureliae]|uniref:DUF2202 domain-containing protein n=1 Tax=Novipirellula aureliae TaxID=2527966 RepID=A0A5C6DE82_9BACT|nr:DUF2202 domain-containing protein [Novipirellula aureliae]TWU34107.1 hypothetical protein Q31b_55780 [Novipirellula aureliae]
MKVTSMFCAGLIVVVSTSGLHAQSRMIGCRGCRAITGASTSAAQPLSQAEQDLLIGMLAEEKLAHDVYVSLAETTSQPIFTNISNAESRHQNALRQVAIRYAINVPSNNEQVGVFQDPKFQTLFDNLVEQGRQSALEAAKVGAKIEEMDIADLQEAIDASTHENVQFVYRNLERASRNHLRAFANSIKMLGGTYTSEYLSQDEFDRIADSTMETGGNGAAMRVGAGNGMGRRNGTGAGNGMGRGNGTGAGNGMGRRNGAGAGNGMGRGNAMGRGLGQWQSF